MLTMQLLENESIRNFIYDESPRKLLIGSRRIGKTSALLLNMFRNSTGPLPRDSFYIVSFSKGINTIKDNLLEICKDFNYKYIEVENRISKTLIKIKIGESTIYITSAKEFMNAYRYIRFKDIYIDEPNCIADLNNLLEEVDMRTIWTRNDHKVIVAGSSSLSGINLRDLSANINYSRHTAVLDNNKQLEELKQIMSTERFRTEIMCEFI